jgi:aminotransferase
VFTREELLQIAALAEEFDVFVLTDEVYEHIVFDGRKHTYFATLPGMAKRTLMCSSLSKTFSITGWRLGYVHAAPEIIAQARKVHDFLTVGAAAPLQQAVVTALNFPESYYAGLAAGAQVSVRREENPSSPLKLDANSTLALPAFAMDPLSITYWVVEAS